MNNDNNLVREAIGLVPLPPEATTEYPDLETLLEDREGVQRALMFVGWQMSMDRKRWEDVPSFVTPAATQSFYDGLIGSGGTLYTRRLVQTAVWHAETNQWAGAGPAFVQGEWVLTMTREAPAVEGGEHA